MAYQGRPSAARTSSTALAADGSNGSTSAATDGSRSAFCVARRTCSAEPPPSSASGITSTPDVSLSAMAARMASSAV
ncbi:MAG: hypothetical protein R2873_06575 [Caldilineaceae bacterium]